MVSRNKIRVYLTWFLVALAIFALINLMILSLEWRPVYQYREFYRESPAPEKTYIGIIRRNPIGKEWVKVLIGNDSVRLVDKDVEPPPGFRVVKREYSYRLVSDNLSGGEIDIYGAGADVRQLRLLSGTRVEIIGKVVWYEVEGRKLKRELWPKRVRMIGGD